MSKRVNLKDSNEEVLIPNTTSVGVYDSAKGQALSQTLEDTPDKSTLGIDDFITTEDYSVGRYVYHGNKLWKFTAAHAAGAWTGNDVEAKSINDYIADTQGAETSAAIAAVQSNLDEYEEDVADGTVVAKYADNLKNWADRDSLSVEGTFNGIVQTTGGDVSLDSSKGSMIVSIVAKDDFYAASLINTGFNLLRYATAIGAGYYMIVPALEWGAYGTAAKPNGVLFTDSEGNNLAPTVYFKALSSGVPESATDGTVVTPTVSNGYSFYSTSEAGYLIVNGITLASTCMHVAWSRRYSEYIAVGDADDAGSSIALSTIISTIHSYNLMLAVGSYADRIDFISKTSARWTRQCDRVKPTWTNTLQEDGTTYLHTATISGMVSGGVVECDDVSLTVEGTTISYSDTNASATDNYVQYQLATFVTGTVTVDNDLDIEDFGLTYLSGATGDAFVTMQYAQGYQDGVAQLLANLDQNTVPIICAAFAAQDARIKALEQMIAEAGSRFAISVKSVDADDYYSMGYPAVLQTDGTAATTGAPSSSVVPSNWDADTMGVWTGVPKFIGQKYIDVYAKKVYMAAALSNSTGDWVALN